MVVGAHDWTRVEDNVFHDFHNSWIIHLKDALNTGGLPKAYFARCEQNYGRPVADLLTLQSKVPPPPPPDLGTARTGGPLATAPRVRIRRRHPLVRRASQKTLVVRQVKDGRMVAVIEVVSPGNKDGHEHSKEFVAKLSETLAAGVHVVALDLLPPNRHAPGGLHLLLTDDLGVPRFEDDDAVQPHDRPVALLSYESDPPDVEAYLDFLRVGDPFPETPLFLAPGRHVGLPLASTYEAAYRPLPSVTKEQLETPPSRGRRSRRV